MSLFKKLSYVSRWRKINLFFETFRPTEQTRILDVGAEVDERGDDALQLIDVYPWKSKISAINCSSVCVWSIRKMYPQIEALEGDACELPWPDKSFDIVYSNAVIEHLGNFNKQKQMAREIMRVGKAWFVATPNRWYPFEFHFRLPFVSWLPSTAYRWVGGIISYNHDKQGYTLGCKRDDLRLLTACELQICFPRSRIVKQRVTFMAETLIALGGERCDAKNGLASYWNQSGNSQRSQ